MSTDKLQNYLTSTLQTLKQHPQSPKILTTSIPDLTSNLSLALKNPKYNTHALQLILQVLRITAPKSVLPPKYTTYFFNSIHLLDNSVLVPILDTMLTYKIVLILNVKNFLRVLCACVRRVGNNEGVIEYLVQIVNVYLDEYGKREGEIFDGLKSMAGDVKKSEEISGVNGMFLKRVLGRSGFLDLISEMKEENEFVKMYFVLERQSREKLDYRLVKGKIAKKKYLCDILGINEKHFNTSNINNVKRSDSKPHNSSIMESSFDKENTDENIANSEEAIKSGSKTYLLDCNKYKRLYEIYKQDSGRIYFLQNRKCCEECKEIVQFLSNDNDSKIRAKAVELFDFDPDRILDASKDVRVAVFNRILKQNSYSSEQLLNLFKGCLSKANNEYFDVLDKIQIEFYFLFENKNEPGVKKYLEYKKKTMEKENKKLLNTFKVNNENEKHLFAQLDTTKKKRFYFKYFRIFELENNEIYELLDNDVYCAFLYLKNINNNDFNYEIIKRIKEMNDITHYRRIVDHISEYITKNYNFEGDLLKKEKDFYFYSFFDEINDDILESYLGSKIFYVNYFLSKHASKNDKIFEQVLSYLNDEEDLCKVIELLLHSKNKKLMTQVIHKILESSMTKQISKILKHKPSILQPYLYFYFGGPINMRNENVFVDSIIILSKSKSLKHVSRIKLIYTNLALNLDKEKLNAYYSLACRIKMMTVCGGKIEYRVVGSKIDRSSVPVADRIVYFVCDIVRMCLKGCEDIDIEFAYGCFKQVDTAYVNYICAEDFGNLTGFDK